MYTLIFVPEVEKIISKWKKSNIVQYKKLKRILIAISEDPHHGIGHPEALIGGGGITYSRRISGHDRIIYDVYDDKVCVLIIDLEGHYQDK